VNPGEIVLLGVALACSGWALSTYWRSTKHARERRERERAGARNAEQEARAALVEVCAVCGRTVEPSVDLYDEKTKSWWHRACWRETVR